MAAAIKSLFLFDIFADQEIQLLERFWVHRFGRGHDSELGDLLEDPGISPEEYVVRSSLQVNLEEMMSSLTNQQQQILKFRFGLKDTRPLTLAQIGKLLNMSRERVRQIERDAMSKLRKRKAEMSEYLAS